MIIYSIIQKSQLEGAHRMDAEYYQPEYLEVHNKINSLGIEIKLLRNIVVRPVITGSTPKARDCKGDDTDIKFIKTDTLREGEIVFENADCLPVKNSRKHSEPQEGDVLVTIIGATHDIVGRSAMVFADDPKMNINQNIALIRVNTKLILPSFLEAFLQGKFGRDQLWQQSRQTEQVNLNCREVELVKIPIASLEFQKNIDSLINLSRKLKNDALIFYKQAEDLLLEELGLQNFQVEDDLSFVVNLSDIKSANRVDAEHFQPKYDKLLDKIKQTGGQVLTDVIKNVSAKFDILKTQDDTFKYVELANINSSIGIIDGYSEVLGKEAPSRAKRLLKRGDVIVSSVEGSLEKVALVDDTQNGYLASTGFFQFRSDEILPEVLLILAKSIVIQWQLKKHCTGTILTAVPSESLKKMFVPTIPKPTQQKITEMVRKSHQSRKKSKELLEQAKSDVEEMIEKGY